ncbi:DUF6010 family protein [uncultured Chitinophaga sp.]|jgi:hypothetical protein|uniref:DUF6010 family protein n=1 Tax=uncultured Chitinophaga sp. TaxID=339340 RepID=UPI002615D32D|nr:DUF6010 family protein [uncultured Chitinophaga sp.]
MGTQLHPEFTMLNGGIAVVIAMIYILLSSLIKEPERQKFNAIMVGGAGAAYLSGGLGGWEFAYCSVAAFIAYKGLRHYYFIGIGWIMHSCWDIVHHLYGNPIVPFSPSSSAGCAVCDAVLALWFFLGAPAPYDLLRIRALANKI